MTCPRTRCGTATSTRSRPGTSPRHRRRRPTRPTARPGTGPAPATCRRALRRACRRRRRGRRARGRPRGRGVLSTLLLTAGLQLFVAAGLLAAPALRGDVPWPEVAALGGAAAGLVALAALGLGALGVEGSEQRHGLAFVLGNGTETLAS